MLRLQQLYRTAALLALITIYYNIAEGVISVWFGAEDEAISLFGFGLDSFERRALRITGGAFYMLAAGMILTAILSIMQGHKPVTTFWGIIVSVVSIVTMQVLIHYKMKVGTALNSQAILADAACTRTCLQLSVVLLLASASYTLTGIGYLDAIGSVIIAVLSIREGREALNKAKGLACSCSCTCSTAG